MRVPRIYEPQLTLELESSVTLDDYGAGHVSRVLRLKEGDEIRLFDGKGHEFLARLTTVGKKTTATLIEKLESNVESPLQTELLQVISRGDRMDFTIQKAVELGISRIVPLTSERCGVKLDKDRALKKIDSYQKIAIAACEQCGRNVVPEVTPLISLDEYLKELKEDKCSDIVDANGFVNLTLDPRSEHKLTTLRAAQKYRILIGPEGGFTDDEVNKTIDAGFVGVTLGPRILRTETAALVTLSILGSHLGDL